VYVDGPNVTTTAVTVHVATPEPSVTAWHVLCPNTVISGLNTIVSPTTDEPSATRVNVAEYVTDNSPNFAGATPTLVGDVLTVCVNSFAVLSLALKF
jgi:hypothetical protein